MDLKKLVFVSLLLVSFLSQGQQFLKDKDLMKVDIYNYDLKFVIKSKGIKDLEKKFSFDFHSLASGTVFYLVEEYLNLTKEERGFLEEYIDQIAIAFYLEGIPVMIDIVEGYSGCVDVDNEIKEINGERVLCFKHCVSCTGSQYSERWVKIFNHRMSSMLKI